MKPILLATLISLALPVHAGMLYKAIGPNGTVIFSDTPPEGATIIEQRAIGNTPSPPQAQTAPPPVGVDEAFQSLDSDLLLAQANARVDMAERALAHARAGKVTPSKPGLDRPQRSLVDDQRAEFYKRDLKIARMELVELLRARQQSGLVSVAAFH